MKKVVASGDALSHFVRVGPSVSPIPKGSPVPLLLESPAEPVAPAPVPKPSSYEVRIRPGIGDTIFVVGHDRRGEPMVEARFKRHHVDAPTVAGIERWCRDHDDEPDVRLA